MAVLEHHMREAVTSYVSGEVSLTQFQEWFVPRAWEVLAENAAGADIAAEIELLLAEFTSGDLTERQLRDALKQHALVPAAGSVIVDTLTGWLETGFWTAPAGGVSQRWSTSAVGADLGNTTVDLRKQPSPLDGVRLDGVDKAA